MENTPNDQESAINEKSNELHSSEGSDEPDLPHQEEVVNEDVKPPAGEFREIDIDEPLEKPGKAVTNMQSPGLSVVENITSLGKRYSFKEWSRSTLVYTKQLLSENFGFGTKTVDMDIEQQIDLLEDSKKLCNFLYIHCQTIAKTLAALTQAEKDFGLMMNEMSLKGVNEYKEELACNGEMFRSLSKTTSALEGVLNMFSDNIATLNNKTIEDCIQSIKQYDVVRVEYDAYRVQYEEAKKCANGNAEKMKEAEDKYQSHLQKFNRSRADICTKMKLVEENKNKVLKRNLMILKDALVKRSREASDNLGEISSHYEFRPIAAHSWLENNE